MTLIERLRGWLVADYIEAYTTGSTLIREAADEIERLTAENAALRAALLFYRDEAAALAKHLHWGAHTQAVLASITVLALDAGRRADTAIDAWRNKT